MKIYLLAVKIIATTRLSNPSHAIYDSSIKYDDKISSTEFTKMRRKAFEYTFLNEKTRYSVHLLGMHTAIKSS